MKYPLYIKSFIRNICRLFYMLFMLSLLNLFFGVVSLLYELVQLEFIIIK